jgi:fructose-bisphosphate aldolase class II
VCKERYLQFGCEGQAGRLQPRDLAEMARAYASGALAQTVV